MGRGRSLLRPRGGMLPVETGRAAALFQEGFAEAMAWWKAQGVSRGEVVRIAVNGVPRNKVA